MKSILPFPTVRISVAFGAVALFLSVGVAAETGAELPVRRLPRENQLAYYDSDGDVKIAKSAGELQRRKEETLKDFTSLIGKLPGAEKRCPLDIEIDEEVDMGSYVRRLISYQSEPGGRVPAYLLIPKEALKSSPDKKFPAVLALHPTNQRGPMEMVGLGESRERMYAKELAERGYVVIAPHYPLLGQFQPDLKQLGWESGTMKAIWDNSRCLDLLDSLPYVQHGKYAAIGHSLGGHNSVFIATFDPRIKAVVSCCGLDSFLDYYSGDPKNWVHGRGWCQDRYMPKLAGYQGRLEELPVDFYELVAGLAPRPTMIIAPLGDSNFKADSVDRIAAAARPVFQLFGAEENLKVIHPDTEHTFPMETHEPAYRFIDRAINPQH
ncbi:prolyl oligopeptidase family serine peptidase [Blastopirellula sp. JC732]|uniref:Prolyl oligopeptidase family serine peptidase n=1 Tax=Blastopirellula sediminis TaxID=2894196 RepID=A0A9X1SG22_9BACT|nr:prolyl oligopeptidase family serine peptidase [Blastopirellula sediminis]MCC9609042.1 prolyl oligopeptidase family serine peptidase [Blastopirellula sediminis]MCC9628181.1 prolyl oligopeptidase family serine peptidase [Blastopirellula sediminis]